jgi:hypothetical protein
VSEAPAHAGTELELDPDLEGLEDLDLATDFDLDPGAPAMIGGAAEFSEGDFITAAAAEEEEDENAKTQPDLEPVPDVGSTEVELTREVAARHEAPEPQAGADADLFGVVGTDLSQLEED